MAVLTLNAPGGNAAASDDTYFNFAADTDLDVLSLAVETMPSNFFSMDDLSITVEYSQIGRVDDTLTLEVRIMRSGTVYAAADAGGGWVSVDVDVTNTTDVTVGPLSFAYVNPSSKFFWDSVSLEFRQGYIRNMGGDTCNIRIDYFELTGNYTPQTVSGSGGLTIGASSLSGLGEVSRVGSGGLSTAATLLSGTGLTGATEARIEITWAEVNVPIAPANTSLGQGALVVPSVQIKAPSGTEAALTVPAAQLSGAGTRGQTATADLNVPAIILASAGERTIVGSGGLDIPAIVMGATGSAGSVFEGTAALATGAVSLDSTGERVVAGSGGLEIGTTLLAATGGISRVGSGGLTVPSVIMDGTGERIITGSGTAIPTLSDLVLNEATDTLSLTSDIPCTIYWARHVDGTVIDDSDAADIIAGTGTGFIEGGSFAVGVGPNSPAITFATGNDGIQEISFVGQTADGLTSNVLTSGIDIATVVEGTEPVSVAHLNRYVLVEAEPQLRIAHLDRYVLVDTEPQLRVAHLNRYVIITTV